MRRLPIIFAVLCTAFFATVASGQRGGFDPKDWLQRMDRNKNGILERDEVDGRAEGWLKRTDPDINFDKGVKIDKLAKKMAESMERRRREGDRDRGRDRDRDRDRGRDRDRDENDESSYDISALVPGFGELPLELPEVTAFGEYPSDGVDVRKEDYEKAGYVMGRYDRNKDGQLEMSERDRSSWSDDPYKYDLNRDGKISKGELARRYALHRVDEADRKERGLPSRYSRNRGDRNEEPAVEIITGAGSQIGYTSSEERLPAGLPEWFAEKDKNGDGQLSMDEFLAEVTVDEVAKFTEMDKDNNGILIASELGVTASEDEKKSRSIASRSKSSSKGRGSSSKSSSSSKVSSAEVEKKYLDYATGRLKRYDTNGDGVLSIAECKEKKPGLIEADRNKDGKITAQEIAAYYQKLYKR